MEEGIIAIFNNFAPDGRGKKCVRLLVSSSISNAGGSNFNGILLFPAAPRWLLQ
jgi:hypothetical protein